MSKEIINFENVSYSYSQEAPQEATHEKWAIKNINLTIMEGDFLAVMGASGCGKTSFCSLINGIIPHSLGGLLLGTVRVAGELTTELSVPQLARKVGTVLDDPDVQLFTSSVRHEAAFGPENLLLPVCEIEERVNFALAATGLCGFEERSPSALSGGEKQRLAIAAALSMLPKILVLDDPLSRLDPEGRREVMSVIRELRQKYQLTVVMAAHDSGIAAEFADRICVLKDGTVAACGPPNEIFSNNELIENCGIQPISMSNEQLAISNEQLAINNERLIISRMAAVSVVDFCYTYPLSGAGVSNINLTIDDKEFVAVMGRNGCGKTTLLKGICGLLRPSAGDVFIRGKNTRALSVSEISKEVGFVMQNPDNQLFTDAVCKEVSFALKNFGLPKTEIKRRVEEALCAVGLENAGESFPHALSRAQRTRTVIACILAMGCKIIILDEPDVGQDYRGATGIMDIAAKLHEKGHTIILVTHNTSLASDYAQRVITIGGNTPHSLLYKKML